MAIFPWCYIKRVVKKKEGGARCILRERSTVEVLRIHTEAAKWSWMFASSNTFVLAEISATPSSAASLMIGVISPASVATAMQISMLPRRWPDSPLQMAFTSGTFWQTQNILRVLFQENLNTLGVCSTIQNDTMHRNRHNAVSLAFATTSRMHLIQSTVHLHQWTWHFSFNHKKTTNLQSHSSCLDYKIIHRQFHTIICGKEKQTNKVAWWASSNSGICLDP